MDPLPILHQRRIEANVLRHMYEAVRDRFGEAEARAVLQETVSKAAIQQGADFAEKHERAPDLADFYDLLSLWTTEDALEIEVLESSPTTLHFNVKRCRYAEMYREMGLGDIGDLLSCQRDGDFCIGYNPDIEFKRTQTIMKGAAHCDFRYSLSSNKGAPRDGGPNED
jgi:hypothetical protein